MTDDYAEFNYAIKAIRKIKNIFTFGDSLDDLSEIDFNKIESALQKTKYHNKRLTGQIKWLKQKMYHTYLNESRHRTKKRLETQLLITQLVINGLNGHPFNWTDGQRVSYTHKLKKMGITLVTASWLKRNNYRLKKGASPVGWGYFRAPISNSYALYVKECQSVKLIDNE